MSHHLEVIQISMQLTSHAGLVQVLSYPIFLLVLISPTQMEMENDKPRHINHTEEVIIGTEQGTMFPTKIGTSMCNVLIVTGATKSCIHEKYYQSLSLTKIQCI